MRSVIDLVKDTEISIKSPKENVVVLRSKQDSLTIFMDKFNETKQLKNFLNANSTLDTDTINSRLSENFR